MSPHIPSFPPDFYYDLAPGDPFKGEPPLPGFLRHSPWLTADQRAEIEAVAGRWATRRAEAMLPPTVGAETVKRIAVDMSESYMSRKLAGLPLPAPPKVRRKPVKKEIEELARVMKPKELTPELEEELVSSVREAVEIEGRLKRPMTTEYKMELARSVVVWAEGEGVTIPESEGRRIVEKAIAGLVPAER